MKSSGMFITVYTPTYNRAYRLLDLYESLERQQFSNFEWLIVDDGSNDNTKELVDSWMAQSRFPIRYIKQSNQGVVAAHNTALSNIESELAVCVDSDDYLTDDALSFIYEFWLQNGSSEVMGFVGLDVYKNGKVVGDEFPPDITSMRFSDIRDKYQVYGDKKYVVRVDCVKKVLPYPSIEGERLPAPSFIYLLLENEFKFLVINKPLCIVEYLEDGISMNKMSQYVEHPNAFAFYRLARIASTRSKRVKLKNYIHYISSKFLGDKAGMLKDAKSPFLILLLMPLGYMLSVFIRIKAKGPVSKKLNK